MLMPIWTNYNDKDVMDYAPRFPAFTDRSVKASDDGFLLRGPKQPPEEVMALVGGIPHMRWLAIHSDEFCEWVREILEENKAKHPEPTTHYGVRFMCEGDLRALQAHNRGKQVIRLENLGETDGT